MAIIDTLKLARALHDKVGFTQEAADATAEAINAALGEVSRPKPTSPFWQASSPPSTAR